MERRIVLSPRERAALERESRRTTDARLRTRLLIIIHSADRWGRPRIAAALRCDVGTVSDVRGRWRARGREGLTDRRVFNGTPKVDEDFRGCVEWMLTMSPPDFGHRRPTWTQALLITTALQYTRVAVSTTTMSRVLKSLRARLGRPKPLAPCPWTKKARRARVRMLLRMVGSLPPGEVCVWEDEIDLDLNPKIGRDWMLPGTQRTVMTPGKNRKRYFAMALDARTDRLTWVSGERKNADLFIELLRALLRKHPAARRIHLILDNYVIHSCKKTRLFLEGQPRLRLHFLPPYSPDDNRIEREVCRELHANVTVNHTHETIEDLAAAASGWLRGRDLRAVAKSRKAI
jgi:hypothetical protein